MSDQVALGYPDHLCLLLSCKCVEHTLELTGFPFQQRPDPSCWGSHVGVKPVRMISGGVGAPPELHRGFDPICCISYGLFIHTHAYGRSIPPGIVGASQVGRK